MKANDLRAKTPDELRTELLALKKEQFNLRFQMAAGEVGNSARVRQVRRNVARVKTVLTEKARRAAEGGEAV